MLKSVQFLQKRWQLCCICCVFASALDCMSVTQGLPLSLKVTHTEYNIISALRKYVQRTQTILFVLLWYFKWFKIPHPRAILKAKPHFVVKSFLVPTAFSTPPALSCHESRCETDKAIFFIASCGVWSIFVIMISQIVNNNLQQTAKHVLSWNM